MLRETLPPDLPEDVEALAAAVVDAVVAVRKALGSGLYERLYASALAIEFEKRNIPFARETAFPVRYEGRVIGSFRADFLIDDKIVLELKAVQELHPTHFAQALTYLRGSGRPLALLVNCHAVPLAPGIRRFVNSSALVP